MIAIRKLRLVFHLLRGMAIVALRFRTSPRAAPS